MSDQIMVSPGTPRRAALAIAVLLQLAITVHASAQTLPNLRDNPAQHEAWFIRRRAFPLDSIPPGTYQEAVRVFRRQAGGRAASPIRFAMGASNGWTAIGPTTIIGQSMPATGRVAGLAVSHANTATIYAAGAHGGVWKSTNSGGNWVPVSDNECSLAMGDLTIDPVNANILYAGTGEYTNSGSSYYGCGMLRSTDAGQTWLQLGASIWDTPTGGARFSAIVVDPNTAGSATNTTVWAATNMGLWKSVNSGGSWARVTTLAGNAVSDFVIDPTNVQRMWAAVGLAGVGSSGGSNGVYYSSDGGAVWTKLSAGFFPNNVGRIRLAVASSNPNRVIAAVHNIQGGGLRGIARSNDGGATWDTVSTGASCASQCWYDMYLEVHPTNADIVFFGGLGLYRSTNGGASFSPIGTSIHVDQHAMAFDPSNPQIIYAGNDGGIYRSADGGNSWTSLNNDIALTQFYPGISLHPTDPNRTLGGTQDNGTNEYTGTTSWLHVMGGDGGFTAINHQDGSTAWAETQWFPSSGYSGPRRRDGGAGTNFPLKVNGIAMDDRADFIPPLVMDPTRPTTLYFGTYRLYRTRDNGENWSAISTDLSSGSGVIFAIGVPPADSATIYVATSDARVQVSSDYGANFTLSSGLPGHSPVDFAFDPSNPARAWVVFSGFTAGQRVYFTENRGATWTNVSGNLPGIPLNAIEYISLTNELVVGTDVGLYKSADLGATWAPWVGIPNVAVFDLVFQPATGRLVAATHGRGMFGYNYPPGLALRGDVSRDFRVGALDAQAVLTSVVGMPLPAGYTPAPHGDANCDGSTSAVDAQMILAYVVGLTLPTGACVGQYR